MKKKGSGVVVLVVVLLLAGGAFWGGVKYGQSSRPKRMDNVRLGSLNTTNGGEMMSGEILSKDESSVTVKLTEGGSKIIFLTSETKINKMASIGLGDLAVGEQVSVNGKTNTDGSLSATNISVRPADGGQPMSGDRPPVDGTENKTSEK
jgi:hypothetical protein